MQFAYPDFREDNPPGGLQLNRPFFAAPIVSLSQPKVIEPKTKTQIQMVKRRRK